MLNLAAVTLGFVLALIAVTWGCVLHLRWIDRKLIPPPQKPEKPKVPEPQPIAPPPPYVPTQALPMPEIDVNTGGQV